MGRPPPVIWGAVPQSLLSLRPCEIPIHMYNRGEGSHPINYSVKMNGVEVVR